MEMFFDNEEIVSIGVSIMYVIIFIVLFQIRQVIFTGCLRGAGDTFYTAVSAAISVTVIRTLGSYIFGYMLGWGITGVWMGIISDQISRYILSGTRFRKGKWVNIKI